MRRFILRLAPNLAANKGSTLSLNIVAIRFVSADVALVDSINDIGGRRTSGGTAQPNITTRGVMLLVRQKGSWWIAAQRIWPVPTNTDIR